MDLLETQLKALLKAVEMFVKQRKESALAMGDFADSLASLSSSEIGKSLGSCLAHLGEVEKKAQDIWKQQTTADEDSLENVVDEYLRIVGSAKVINLPLLNILGRKRLILFSFSFLFSISVYRVAFPRIQGQGLRGLEERRFRPRKEEEARGN